MLVEYTYVYEIISSSKARDYEERKLFKNSIIQWFHEISKTNIQHYCCTNSIV